MQELAVVPRILGALFYYPPNRAEIKQLLSELPALAEIFEWEDKAAVEKCCASLTAVDTDELDYQYSVLFEGQGEMIAPPWGSVYQDKDRLLMADSTINYQHFLQQNQLTFTSSINEPVDQFGLMLMVLALFVEQDNFPAATDLLEKHLLTWCYRYLDLLSGSLVSPFYAALAELTVQFLRQIQQQYQIVPERCKLYF